MLAPTFEEGPMTDSASWRFLAEPPPIPGLTLRGFRGEEDFPEMRRVKLAAEMADGVDQLITLEDFAVVYRHLQNCDPATDMVIAEIDGEMAAYGRVYWWEEYTGARRYQPFCFVVPAARGRGLGAAMLAHGEARLREVAAGHPDGEKTLEVQYNEQEARAAALYAAAGYLPALHGADMVRPGLEDIPEAPLPKGLVVRTPRPDEMRKVWEADQEAFRDHLGAAPPGENDFDGFLTDPYKDTNLWRDAWAREAVERQESS